MKRGTDKYASKETLEKFTKGELSVNVLSLYLVYKNINPCHGEERTDEMAKEMLNWNDLKILRVKTKLVELGLLKIEDDGSKYRYFKIKELFNL